MKTKAIIYDCTTPKCLRAVNVTPKNPPINITNNCYKNDSTE
jgi:hypothetical protein